MRISKRLKRILLIVIAALTAVSLVHMIWVRASAAGYALITMNSSTGHHIAVMYNASVVIFVVFAAILATILAVTVLRNKKRAKLSE